MARIRTIKPEFWAHEDLSSLPEPVHILAAALLNYADDEGYFNANTQLVKACCFPIREPSVTIAVGLQSLSGIGYIRAGKGADGKMYGHILKFKDHQVINKPKKSKIAVMSIDWVAVPEEYRTNTVAVPKEYREEWKGMEGNGREQGKEETPSSKSVEMPAEQKASRMMINDFRVIFSQNFGSVMPGGCNNTAHQLCQDYTADRIRESFEIAAKQGVMTVAYVEGILKGNGKRLTPITHETESARIIDGNKDAARVSLERAIARGEV